MSLDRNGYLRPTVTDAFALDRDAEFGQGFEASCPGVLVRSSSDRRSRDPDFGPVLRAWRAWATDAKIRNRGASGGVLTAINQWLLDSGTVSVVAGASQSLRDPLRTSPSLAATSYEASKMAGSRYAPVSIVQLEKSLTERAAVTCKPCEASALRQELDQGRAPQAILSFFCAGTPSQESTSTMVEILGGRPEEVRKVDYRGDGWPGSFAAWDQDGRKFSTTYQRSWGEVLGPTMQSRCKICVDGVGESSDIAAADYWEAGPDGYPVFEDAPGISLLVARTQKGIDIVLNAERAGYIQLSPADLSEVRKIQPHQVTRRRTMFGRLLILRLLGRPTPTYAGFGLWRLAIRHPIANARAAFGTLRRAIRGRL